MPKKGGFNWSGIIENNDGSFIAKGKPEKRRLLKSLHESGFKVRSRRNPDRSWSVSTVGTMRPVRRSVARGYHPAVRASRTTSPTGRYVRLGTGLKRYPIGPQNRPWARPMGATISMGSGYRMRRPTGPSLIQRYNARLQRIQEEKMERKKTEQEINKKMESERIQKEREETARQVQKNRLHEESMRFERAQRANRLREQASQPHVSFHAGPVVPASQKKSDEPKINSVALQAEREREIVGQ